MASYMTFILLCRQSCSPPIPSRLLSHLKRLDHMTAGPPGLPIPLAVEPVSGLVLGSQGVLDEVMQVIASLQKYCHGGECNCSAGGCALSHHSPVELMAVLVCKMECHWL